MNLPIRVVVTDDSPFVCRLLSAYMQSSPDIKVVGTALGGAQAIEMVKGLRPDVVTLDVEMPDKDGLETLDEIMRDCPAPVIMVSGLGRKAAEITLAAIEKGAVDFILKYTPGVDTDPEALRRDIVAKVKAAVQSRAIETPRAEPTGRLPEPENLAGRPSAEVARPRERNDRAPRRLSPTDLPDRLLVIGASTGGPVALRELLGELPEDFDAAVIVVQHMPATFTGVLATQLDRQIALSVREAAHGDRLQRGLVLVAPGGQHLLVGPDSRVKLNHGAKIGGYRPSIDATMQSAALAFGRRASGVVLTGMGDDGAAGLASIRARLGTTFAQDAASCVINGMPQRAIDRGVVAFVDTPAGIAKRLGLARNLTTDPVGANLP